MNILAAALAALLAAPALAQPDAAPSAPAATSYDARLTAVSGEVTVYPADGSSDPAAGEEGMLLDEGDRIVVSTETGASAEVALDGTSIVTLSEGTDFTLTKLSRAEAELSLAFGSLIAKIQKLGDDRLQVRTPGAVAAVRGTEFGVEAESGGGPSHVGVFDEGKVEVSGSGGTETLTPNQETSVRQGERPQRPAALQRFAGRRLAMARSRERLAAVRHGWRHIPAARRRAARRRALARQRARRAARRRGAVHRQQQRRERRRRQQPRRRPRRDKK